VVEPVLDAWQRQAGAPHLYAAGTWGPDAADDLLARDGRRWRRP
jgi:glucose-6-phosphate 1-dehydrogenase